MRKITFVLQVLLVLTFSTPTFSQTATPPSAGNGSESNPYQIATLDNLYWLTQSDTVWDKHFIQTSDIDASETINWDGGKGFSPIGNLTIPFTGSYNGNEHVIDSIYINRTEYYIGMFGYLIGEVHIDSLGITNIDLTATNSLGGFIGCLAGRLVSGKITNSYVTGDCEIITNGNQGCMGGLVGHTGGEIDFCFSSVNVSSTKSYVGGLAGANSGEIYNSYSLGKVTGHSEVGGLVGRNGASHFNDYVQSGLIINSYSKADVTGYERVGGMVGFNGENIKNSYSMGDVAGDYGVGGFVGENYYQSPYYRGDITNSYSTGNVTGAYAKGFAGYNRGFITNCLWDIETSGQVTSSGDAIGLTTEEMMDSISYLNSDWDFMDESYNGTEDIWGMNSNENDGYPFLHWQGYTNNVIVGCQTPVYPVSEITFSNVSATAITLESFKKAGYGTTGYVIFINDEDNWDIPVTGIEPVEDTIWLNNGQQCIYFGTSNSPNVAIKELHEATEYYFKIYAYSNCSEIETYEQSGTLKTQSTIAETTVPEGEGSENNPYLITNLKNLAWVMYNDAEWGAYYMQTANIDASETKNWFNGIGFEPIGKATTYFTGVYDGDGYTIDQLNINQEDSLIGLFGIIDMDAKVENLGLTNMSIKGGRYVGGIAGLNYGGEINSCFVSGSCEGNSSTYDWGAIGGLVGYNLGAIKYSYSDADVVSKYEVVGGLTGLNDGFISCSYSAGSVKGTNYVGGLTGVNYYLLYDCYSRSEVTGNNYTGGLVGRGDEFYVLSSFWDTEVSGQNTSYGGVGLTTDLMKKPDDYVSATWDFMDETLNGSADIWGLNSDENGGYPFLWWQGFSNTEEITITDVEVLEQDNILIYPNPVDNILHIKLRDEQECRLIILDITGKVMTEQTTQSSIENIDMSSYKPGIYIINIYIGNEVYSNKIIKK